MKGALALDTRIVIGDVGRHGAETLVHVSIINVLTPEDIAPGGRRITIGHAPFTEDALARSVDALERGGVEPAQAFLDAYDIWSTEEGADAYSITAAESLEQIFAALRGQ